IHDLLAEANDTPGLLSLVERRLEAETDAGQLERLRYERARLQRSVGDRHAALETLDELFHDSPEHVGGIALSVEIFVSLERYPEAVVALQRLAAADVPPAQKRLSHLGASDFLSNRLGRPEEALAELEAVVD